MKENGFTSVWTIKLIIMLLNLHSKNVNVLNFNIVAYLLILTFFSCSDKVVETKSFLIYS